MRISSEWHINNMGKSQVIALLLEYWGNSATSKPTLNAGATSLVLFAECEWGGERAVTVCCVKVTVVPLLTSPGNSLQWPVYAGDTFWLTGPLSNELSRCCGEGGAPSVQRSPLGFGAVGVNFRSLVAIYMKYPWSSFLLTAVVMSNNNASNNLIIAQRAVKQLRLEASIRRIKVTLWAPEATLKHGRLS